MNDKQKAVAAWILFGLILTSVIAQLIYNLTTQAGEETLIEMGSDIVWVLGPVIFGFVGALIISRQPRNVIGLLLILPALVSAISPENYLADRFPMAPANPNLFVYILLWFSGWIWLLLIMPILFILVLFPTGKPFTSRWRWPIYMGLAMSLVFILFGTFVEEFGVENPGWTIPNPIGFIPTDWWDQYLATPWYLLMPVLTILCASALFVRFRRAGIVEREQIKWLLYAGVLFAAVYAAGFLNDTMSDNPLWTTLLGFTLWTIPVAIGVAILRYHLFDIDIIIRRTLLYGLLTAVLVAIYFGLVLLTQFVFIALTGQESPIAVVISTLVIAALFNPLRKRIQAFIDRRFYRSSYDAVLILQQFAQTARDEVDLEQLSKALLQSVKETMQPETAVLWLRKGEDVEIKSSG